jgi:hypothetical protein
LEDIEPDTEVSDKNEEDVESIDTRIKQLTPDENNNVSNLLDDIALDLDLSEKTGSSINEGLANILQSLLKDKIPEEKAQAKIDKYPRPANVEGLQTPRVNPLIWNQLPAPVRTHDSKSQKTQNALVASLVAMIKATDCVLQQKGQTQNKELVTYLTDAIALSLQCYHDINSTRRQAMKKDLHRDYAALCSSSTVPPSSGYLFGDLSKLTKDISEANKLTKKVRPPHYSNVRGRKFGSNSRYHSNNQSAQGNRRFNPYQRPRNDFLSKGHPPRSKTKKEGEAKQH